ncbi:unnamed protein product [Effrenium voratum]|nr:unnamed protein product [Effrenium voratum]
MRLRSPGKDDNESGACSSPSPRQDPPLCATRQFDITMEASGTESSSGECSPERGIQLPRCARIRPPPPPLPPKAAAPPPSGRWNYPSRSRSRGRAPAPSGPGLRSRDEHMQRPLEEHALRAELKALLPPGKKICFDFAGGNCAHGDSCHWYHAEERELREARRLLRQIQCKHGANCLVGHCVFGHAAEARHSDWRDWNNWSGTQQVPSGTEGSESETDLSQIETDGSSTSASNSEASPSCADAEASETRQQFLQTKLAPVLIFQGPGICVVSKPAGWSATAHGCSEDQGQPLGLKDLLCSGCVEPLSRHPAAPVGHWKAFLSPSALTSGPAILVQTGHARRRLARAFTTGRVVTYSLALVEGKLDPERSFAACRREDGMLEVLGIAGFQRVSKETWGGEASCQSYTLVLVKAAGSALGGERRLLQLAWGTAAVGDVDFGARTEQCFGGRPFFHCLATLLADPWWWADTTYPAIMVCPFPDDLRSALSQLDVSEPLALQEGKPRDEKAEKLLASATSIGAAVKEALVKRGLLPAELTESLGVPATCGVEAERRPPPDPTPYGMDRWEKPRWEQDVPRSRWIVSFLQQAVAGAEEFQVPIQADGWVFALDILGRFPQLAEACWSNVHILSRLLAKDPIRSLEVKVVRNRVAMRRVSAMDRLQAFVEAYVSGLPPETKLPVAELLCNEHVKRLFNGVELPDNPEKSLLRCLRPCALFDPEPKASHLTLRPARERLRLGLEGLLASPEGGLHQKIEQGQGSVSLSWLLRHFGKQLLGSVRLTPQQVREALSRSEELEFDCLSFTVRMRGWQRSWLPPLLMSVPSNRERMNFITRRVKGGSGTWADEDRERCCAKTLRKLREILDFYMHPFSIQHNCLLRHGAEEGSWVWPLQRLAKELQRVKVLLTSLSASASTELLEALCQKPGQYMELVSHLETQQLAVKLRYIPDLRMPVVDSLAPAWAFRLLIAHAEVMPVLPPDAAVVLSYNLQCREGVEEAARSCDVAEFLRAPRLARERWRRRILRQLFSYKADILCLQHVQADPSLPCSSIQPATEGPKGSLELQRLPPGSLLSALTARLTEEDFDWCVAPAATPGWCNAIAWKRSRWCLRSWGCVGGCITSAFSPIMDDAPNSLLTVANIGAESGKDFAESLSALKACPMVLCGATGADISSPSWGLGGKLRSAHKEILGSELPWTEVNEHELRCSDGMWIAKDVAALAVLDGHSKPPWDAEGRIRRCTWPTDHLLTLAVTLRYCSDGRKTYLNWPTCACSRHERLFHGIRLIDPQFLMNS